MAGLEEALKVQAEDNTWGSRASNHSTAVSYWLRINKAALGGGKNSFKGNKKKQDQVDKVCKSHKLY